jgi:hypothetical protein
MLRVLLAAILLNARTNTPTFDFHNNFWINLHHSLYRAAQPPGPAPRAPVAAPVGILTADEKREWDAAVQYYRDHLIKRDVLFDSAMDATKRALAASETATQLSPDRVGAEVAGVLNGVAPVYRAHWWPKHGAANRLWISSVQALIAQLGDRLGTQLSAAYKTQWYPNPIHVDVTPWAGPRLVAYTNGQSDGFIVVSSTDPCDQGMSALETLYHEVSHTIVGPDVGQIGPAIRATAARLRVAEPEGLWHALMFYTQGELLRRDLLAIGVGYEPGAGICNQFNGTWSTYRDALSLFWTPYLNGKTPLDSALTNIVRSL